MSDKLFNKADKEYYKKVFVEIYKKKLTDMEQIEIIARHLTFVSKYNIYDEYIAWSYALKRELEDEKLRIAMMEEREEK
jgi:hypothetical protein